MFNTDNIESWNTSIQLIILPFDSLYWWQIDLLILYIIKLKVWVDAGILKCGGPSFTKYTISCPGGARLHAEEHFNN